MKATRSLYGNCVVMSEALNSDETRLNQKQVALFVEKFRALGLEDRSASADVIEVLNEALVSTEGEVVEIAKTICEILEPERLGGIVWMTCQSCKQKLTATELEDKMDTCFQCRISGPPEFCL